jgi:hypothetical protein
MIHGEIKSPVPLMLGGVAKEDTLIGVRASVIVVRHRYRQRYHFRDLERGCEKSLVRGWRLKRG